MSNLTKILATFGVILLGLIVIMFTSLIKGGFGIILAFAVLGGITLLIKNIWKNKKVDGQGDIFKNN